MISQNRIILVMLILFYFSSLMGQENETLITPCEGDYPQESVSLLCDRDYYLAGDKLWFKAYVFLNGELSSDWSKVLYIELFNDQQDVLTQQKYELRDGMVDDVLVIPEDVNTGNYFIRAYTQYGRNFPIQRLFTKVVSVVNPNSEITVIKKSSEAETEKDSELQIDRKSTISLDLSIPKKRYDRREKVELKIAHKNEYIDLVVGVRKKGTSHSKEDLNRFISHNPWLGNSYARTYHSMIFEMEAIDEGKAIKHLKWIPELRGLTLSGQIRNKITGNPVPDVYCITSVIEEGPQIHLSKSNKEGMFVFSYDHLQEDNDIYVAIRNYSERNLEILINKDFSTVFPEMKALHFPFDSAKHALFEELLINKQLNKRFISTNNKSAYGETAPQHLSFNIALPDIRVEIQDFIHIPTMLEIFRELIPTVSVRGKTGSRKLNVYNRETFIDYTNPLVLIDNVPISDIESMLLIDPRKLISIDVYNSDYYLGDYTFGGIISIKTNTDDFAGFKWTDNSVFLSYKTLHPRKVFQHPDYDVTGSYNDRKPDFRTLLYWNPEVKIEDQDMHLTFFTSDDLSEYEIVVHGYTQEGVPCFGTIDFEVVK